MRKFGFRDSLSIRTQFIVLSCVVVAVVVMIGNGLFLFWEKGKMTRELNDKGMTISFFIAQLATDPFLYKDVLKIDNIAAEAIKEKEVVYAFFLDANGKPVTSLIGSVDLEDNLVKGVIRNDEDPQQALKILKENKDILSLTTPITDGSTVLGSLVLGMSTVNVNRQFSLFVGYMLLFACGIIFCLSISLFLMFRHATVRPIQRIIDIAEKIATGDLRDPAVVGGSKEIMALSNAINTIAVSFHDIVLQVVNITDTVSKVTSNIAGSSKKVLSMADVQKGAVSETAAAVDNMNASTAELSATASKLATLSEETSSSVMQMNVLTHQIAENSTVFHDTSQETASSVEEMVASIKNIAENLNNLSAASSETFSALNEMDISVKEIERNANISVELAEKVEVEASGAGLNSLNIALNGMAEIKEIVEAISDTIKRLHEKSASIGKILNVIDNVADQTNLLALNASILASKAGVNGKGFSVVAYEIKELAERTALSTTEISNVISSVQKETIFSVEMAAKGIKAVEKGMSLFNDVKTGLNNIITSSRTSTEMARMISKAASEEALAITQITGATNSVIEQITQITDATDEQSKGSRLILETMEKIKDVSALIQKSTKEQSHGSQQITVAMENLNHQTAQIVDTTDNQRSKSMVIAEAMDRILKATGDLIESSVEMDGQIMVLSEEAENLLNSLKKFRI